MPVLESPPAAPVAWEQPRRAAPPAPVPALGQQHQDLKFTLHRKLLDKINLDALASIETQKLRNEVRSALTQLIDAEQTLLSAVERNQIVSEVLDEVFGLGPLEPLLQDPSVSDILVNTHKQVYVERNGKLDLTNVTFKDGAHLYRIIDKIVSQVGRRVGRRVDESSPMVDARLTDGSRVNAIIPPLAVDRPLLSIRRFGTDKLMPQDLVDRLQTDPRAATAALLRLADGITPRRDPMPFNWMQALRTAHDATEISPAAGIALLGALIEDPATEPHASRSLASAVLMELWTSLKRQRHVAEHLDEIGQRLEAPGTWASRTGPSRPTTRRIWAGSSRPTIRGPARSPAWRCSESMPKADPTLTPGSGWATATGTSWSASPQETHTRHT